MASTCIKRLQGTSWENGGESGNTTHTTQVTPKQREPLDGKMGFIHDFIHGS